MNIQNNISLKKYNTFGIDALAKEFAEVKNVDELKQVLAETRNRDKIWIGGGSNMLITRSVIDELVIKLSITGKNIIKEDEDFVWIEVFGGETLHDVVLWSLSQQYGGLENLSLIPGNIGTAPIQNVGAYGVEIKDVIESCDALDLNTLEITRFSNEECRFGYRDSFFKNEGKGKYIVISVIIKLTKRNHILHLDYGDIRKQLESSEVVHPDIHTISNAVIAIRSSKLPDYKKIGNSGSFFKNPIINKSHFEKFQSAHPKAPFYQVDEHSYKIPAGWLIEHSGYKGYRVGDAGVHDKQALVLVNYGQAKGEELIALSNEIQQKVKELFGIEIHPEVNII